MCLTINLNFHPSHEPLIADRNLVVSKAVAKNNLQFFSPYRRSKIQFEKILTSKLGKSGRVIEEGFHTMRYSVRNKNDINLYRGRLHANDILIIPAVIPKGSKFFVGLGNDIVSNKIMYFADISDLLSYYNTDKLAPEYILKR